MKRFGISAVLAAVLGWSPCSLRAGELSALRITEWMYSGSALAEGVSNEFVEISNIGVSPVDLTGWSFDDNSRTAGSESLSSLGTLAAGESALIIEATAVDFRTEWSLSPTVKIRELNGNNLGRSDEINIFDAAGNLIDRLTFGDQDFAGTIRTQNNSGNPSSAAVLEGDTAAGWVLSQVGDSFGSMAALGGNVANPGRYQPVPEPAAMALIAMAAARTAGRRRR